MIKGVVCLNPSDAYKYLADSYRPYQLRNNKLAATYDGAHGQAAQAQMGMAVLNNAMATSPTALAGARGALRRGTKTSASLQDVFPRHFLLCKVGATESGPTDGTRTNLNSREFLASL